MIGQAEFHRDWLPANWFWKTLLALFPNEPYPRMGLHYVGHDYRPQMELQAPVAQTDEAELNGDCMNAIGDRSPIRSIL